MKALSKIFKENITSASQNSTSNITKKRTDLKNMFDFLELLNLWPNIIGERIAKVTQPMRISNKKLIIYTSHSAFSQQLSMMQSQILLKIKDIYPSADAQIRSLNFITKDAFFNNEKKDVLSNKVTEDYRKNNKLNKYSPTYQRHLKQANDLLGDIEDESVKESLIKINRRRNQKE